MGLFTSSRKTRFSAIKLELIIMIIITAAVTLTTQQGSNEEADTSLTTDPPTIKTVIVTRIETELATTVEASTASTALTTRTTDVATTMSTAAQSTTESGSESTAPLSTQSISTLPSTSKTSPKTSISTTQPLTSKTEQSLTTDATTASPPILTTLTTSVSPTTPEGRTVAPTSSTTQAVTHQSEPITTLSVFPKTNAVSTSNFTTSQSPSTPPRSTVSPTTSSTTRSMKTQSESVTTVAVTSLPCNGECDPITEVCEQDNLCVCRKGLARNETSGMCIATIAVEVEITITAIGDEEAKYHENLGNSTSSEFQKLEETACEPFFIMYQYNDDFVECKVIEFLNGSIIVNYAIVFTEESAQNVSSIEKDIQQELMDPDGAFSTGNLTFDNSSLVVEALDRCYYEELNECSPDAECINEGIGGFTCECNEGFEDIEPEVPGRYCELIIVTTQHSVTMEPVDAQRYWVIPVAVAIPVFVVMFVAIVGMLWWQMQYFKRDSSPKVIQDIREIMDDTDDSGNATDNDVHGGQRADQNPPSMYINVAEYEWEDPLALPMTDYPTSSSHPYDSRIHDDSLDEYRSSIAIPTHFQGRYSSYIPRQEALDADDYF